MNPMPEHKHNDMLKDTHTFAAVLLGLAVKLCGIELLTWDPESIILEVQDSIGHELPEQNINKLLAAVTLVTTDNFYCNLAEFIRICNILTVGVFDPNVFDPADAEEIAWGITEALLIWPPSADNEAPFSDEIIKYIGQAVSAEGILKPPDVLELGIPGMVTTWNQVQGEFADDPAMFGAIQQIE